MSVLPAPRLAILVAAASPLWLLVALDPRALPVPVACLAAILLAAAVSFLRTPGPGRLSIRRTLPVRFSMKAEHEILLSVMNRSRRRIAVELRDDVPQTLEVVSPIPPFILEAGGTTVLPYRVKPLQRGAVQFRKVFLRVSQGGDLVRRQFALEVESRGKVYPCFVGVDQYNLLAVKDRREESVRSPRSSKGQGTDFDSLRSYSPGDDPRRIDWKISAKRGFLVSRNLQVERGQQIAVLIDAGRFMAEPLGERTRFEHAVDAAVMLAAVAQKRGDSVSLACFSNRIESFLPPVKGQRVVPRVLEALADVKPRAVESDYWHAFANILSRLRKRSLIVLLSEVLDRAGSSGLVNNLARSAGKHLILVVVLVDEALRQAAEEMPADLRQGYRKAAASHVALERAMALDDMRAKGILVLETEPRHLSIRLIERYLDIRKTNLL
jgi:uncharacterized protein (DUF58 family)